MRWSLRWMSRAENGSSWKWKWCCLFLLCWKDKHWAFERVKNETFSWTDQENHIGLLIKGSSHADPLTLASREDDALDQWHTEYSSDRYNRGVEFVLIIYLYIIHRHVRHSQDDVPSLQSLSGLLVEVCRYLAEADRPQSPPYIWGTTARSRFTQPWEAWWAKYDILIIINISKTVLK